ncbi:MAG: crossover junction endodeoxyribonuclease RuvC [Microbispora sp.]|nr:crossover junction endodeoxyribonuclease RuvC [Microbispora sp.]
MILALDPGQRTGWAWSNGDCGTLDLSHCRDLGETAAQFHAWLADALWCRRPELLLVERPFGRGAFTADLPLVLCGVAHMVAHSYGVPRRELTASAIKKAVTGNGRAKKAAVIVGVRLDGWAPDTDHAADAAALLMAWRAKQVAETAPRRAA